MTKLVITGILLIVVVEAIALAQLDGYPVVAVTGVVLAVVLVAARRQLTRAPAVSDEPAETDDAAAALQRWLTRTETLISWAEASRSDWDRRLRPMLARQFELAAGQRKAKDPNAFHATGRMLFGEALWQWVDPENISRAGNQEPGPGLAVLDDILQRLERL